MVDKNIRDKWTLKGTLEKQQVTMDSVLLSLRKLREAVLSSSDDNSLRVYEFSIDVSVLAGHYQSYLPSLVHILQVMHKESPLTEQMLNRIAELYILHLVHFNNSLNEAYICWLEYIPTNSVISRILQAWATDDYIRWKLYFDREKDEWRKKVMSEGLNIMIRKSLSSIGKSYISITIKDLEAMLGIEWKSLREKYDCQWQESKDKVIIRKRKG